MIPASIDPPPAVPKKKAVKKTKAASTTKAKRSTQKKKDKTTVEPVPAPESSLPYSKFVPLQDDDVPPLPFDGWGGFEEEHEEVRDDDNDALSDVESVTDVSTDVSTTTQETDIEDSGDEYFQQRPSSLSSFSPPLRKNPKMYEGPDVLPDDDSFIF